MFILGIATFFFLRWAWAYPSSQIVLCNFIVYLCVCVSGDTHGCGCLQKSEEVGSPGIGIAGGCETPNVDAGNRAWLPYKK